MTVEEAGRISQEEDHQEAIHEVSADLDLQKQEATKISQEEHQEVNNEVSGYLPHQVFEDMKLVDSEGEKAGNMVGEMTEHRGKKIADLEPISTQSILKTMIRVKQNAEVFIYKKHNIIDKPSVLSLVKQFEVLSAPNVPIMKFSAVQSAESMPAHISSPSKRQRLSTAEVIPAASSSPSRMPHARGTGLWWRMRGYQPSGNTTSTGHAT